VTPESEKNYLRDVLPDLLDKGREAKAIIRSGGENEIDIAFARGRAEAYYEVLSTMMRQLTAFGIERTDVGLPANFDLTELIK
jgi:hypothetical protein